MLGPVDWRYLCTKILAPEGTGWALGAEGAFFFIIILAPKALFYYLLLLFWRRRRFVLSLFYKVNNTKVVFVMLYLYELQYVLVVWF